MSFFTKYYQNTIGNKRGFKLVLGGTGLGKTSGIVETIKNNPSEKKRFYYMANRLQLLSELTNDLKKEEVGYCLQRRDDEIIRDFRRQELEQLLQHPLIEKYAKKVFPYKNIAIEATLQHFKFISTLRENSIFFKTEEGQELLRNRTRKIFAFFKSILSKSYEEEKDRDALFQLPAIRKFFPYIDFQQNPTKKRIFVVSIQKAFYGFFDGKRMISLYQLKNNKERKEQNIIFLDEFDFLENDLLSQISRDNSIEQPFGFVESFYTVLNKYKLPRENFLQHHESVRKELQSEVIDQVNSLKRKYKIPFPEINHFLCTENELKNTAVFQTRYSISNHSIYLNSKKRDNKNRLIKSFYLEVANEEKPPNAYALLNVVNQVTANIIRIIKELELSDPEVANALIEQCFEKSDRYQRILKRVHQHPYKRKLVSTNISKIYYNGFGLYEVFSHKYLIDLNVVKLKYYSLFSTPESILLRLTKNNLVFGLSATAEIDRFVKNFDLTWLRKELGKSYFDITDLDKSVIREANKTKQFGGQFNEGRNNKISVEIASETVDKKIKKLVHNEVFCNQDFFGVGNKQKYRVKRIHLFFAALDWIIQQGNQSSNLLFYSSFKHILHVFKEVPKPENGLYSIDEIPNRLQNCYKIAYNQTTFLVLFLDASQGKDIAKFKENKADYYALFRKGLPVLLVTTYASAGNGVNLFYFEDKELKNKKDFSNIHLLDSLYYYFNPIDNEDLENEKREKIKANIYYLSKLEKNKIISEAQFKTYLGNIRNIETTNDLYLSTPDALYNQVATYLQAIGRIERSWDKVDNQVIRLEREVYNRLEDFCKIDDGNYKRYRKKYLKNLPYYSYNITQMFEQILKKETERKLEISFQQEEHLQDINEKCKRALKKLVSRLNLVRENKLPKERLDKIRHEWHMLRKIALKHDFSEYEKSQILKKYYCTFETDYYDYEGKSIWLQNETLNIVPRSINPDSSFYEWELDSVYKNVIHHPLLRGHFDYSRYEYGFIGNKIFFTPYFYQCILAGAVGEEVVTAVFKAEKILLNDSEIDNSLFELIDLKIQGVSWYIDAKNYGEQTVKHFEITDKGDHFYHPKLNSEYFKEKAISKWNKVNDFHNQDSNSKIIYINVFGKGDNPIGYYDENFISVGNDFQSAKIIIVPNMIKKGKVKKNTRHYTKDFRYLINQIQKHYPNGKK